VSDPAGAIPPASSIPDDDLHAYVDGQLPPDRHAQIAHALQAQPEAAEQVAAYLAQREALRAGLAPIAAEELPPRLQMQSLIAAQLARRSSLAERRTIWRAAAAVLLAFGIGGAGGWALHSRFGTAPSELTTMAQEAIANHVVYAADRRRPTELGAEQRDDLARWVSNRLGHPVAPPDMSSTGFHYMGGRLAATPQGPAGQFMYQNADGKRLTIFVLPMRDAADTPTRMVDVGSMDGCAWIDKGVGYTVVAPLPPAELDHLATEVRRKLEGAA
jgi:anti-sigma factor RsiW